jgi:hypothetical protein
MHRGGLRCQESGAQRMGTELGRLQSDPAGIGLHDLAYSLGVEPPRAEPAAPRHRSKQRTFGGPESGQPCLHGLHRAGVVPTHDGHRCAVAFLVGLRPTDGNSVPGYERKQYAGGLGRHTGEQIEVMRSPSAAPTRRAILCARSIALLAAATLNERGIPTAAAERSPPAGVFPGLLEPLAVLRRRPPIAPRSRRGRGKWKTAPGAAFYQQTRPPIEQIRRCLAAQMLAAPCCKAFACPCRLGFGPGQTRTPG